MGSEEFPGEGVGEDGLGVAVCEEADVGRCVFTNADTATGQARAPRALWSAPYRL